MKLQLNDKQYDTFDMRTKGERVILITDLENLKVHTDDIYYKWKCSTISFIILVVIQCIIHAYISYFNLIDCENKINHVNETNYKGDRVSKDITNICASYVMHIVLIIGYFIIAFATAFKQTVISFKVFEIYLMIMLISNLFFSFVNTRNLYHVLENIIMFLIVKYLKLLREEYEKICL